MPYQTKNPREENSKLTTYDEIDYLDLERQIDRERRFLGLPRRTFEEIAQSIAMNKKFYKERHVTDARTAIKSALEHEAPVEEEVIEIPQPVVECLKETIVAEPLETASTEMYPITCSVEVAEAQMKPKQKPKRKQVVKRTTIPQTLTAGLGGFRANKITSTIKSMSIRQVVCKASGKPGESRITPISFTLKELYPLPENDDKFAEFKLSRVEISLIGFSGVAPEEYAGTTVIIAPNPDERMAANISELLHHYGVRLCPILACQNSVVRLISVMPRFDETGSNNHYVSGFLQVGEAQEIEWYGATVAIQGPDTSKDLQWTVKLLLTTTIIFRGRQ